MEQSSTLHTPARSPNHHILTLPTEIRLLILEHVLHNFNATNTVFNQISSQDLILRDTYAASRCLSILLVCRQFHREFSRLAFSHVKFSFVFPHVELRRSVTRLQPYQIAAIRDVTFVAGRLHFKELMKWEKWPFDLESMRLDCLTVAISRSPEFKFSYEFVMDVVEVLLRLRGVRRFVVVRNGAHVPDGGFGTVMRRIVGFFVERMRGRVGEVSGDEVWWDWGADWGEGRFWFDACLLRKAVGREDLSGFLDRKEIEAVKVM